MHSKVRRCGVTSDAHPDFPLAKTSSKELLSRLSVLAGYHRVSVHRQGSTFGLHLDGLRPGGMVDMSSAYPQPARLGSPASPSTYSSPLCPLRFGEASQRQPIPKC